MDFEQILQHFCLTADTMPPTDSCSCGDLHSSLLLWEILSDLAGTGRVMWTANTLGLTPRAAYFPPNWCNLAPTGRFGTTGGTFVTFCTELD